MREAPPPKRNQSDRAALLASAALCRLMARLDTLPVPGIHDTLARLVARSMQALYGTRGIGASAAHRSNAAARAGNWLGDCLAMLQAQALPASGQEILTLTALAASAVYALGQAAMGEWGAGGTPRVVGTPRRLPSPLSGIEWSRNAAAVHAYERSPMLPPTAAPTDEGTDSSETDFDDDVEDGPLESLPSVPLDELRAVTESLLTASDRDVNGGPPDSDVAAPPKASLPTPAQHHVDRQQEALLEAHLGELADTFDRRQNGKANDATWTNLERFDRSLLARADAVAWLGTSVIDSLAQKLVAAEQSGPAFGAALSLLCVDGLDATDAVLRAAERGARDTVDGMTEAVLFACNQEAMDRLPLLLDVTASPGARLVATRVMAARETLADHQLELLLGDPDPAVVAAALGAILCAGKAYALPRLEYMVSRPLEDPAATEVLLAASVMGSTLARGRLRARLRADSVSDRLVLAVAACGDEQDVATLAELALAGGPVASSAMVALGWLGSGHALPALRELAAEDAFAEGALAALAQILGRAADLSSDTLGPGRWWAGTPWSVNAPARLLADEDTGALWRELAFLELVARTGQHVPFSPSWPVARQRSAAAMWATLADRLARALPSGSWLYRGQPST
jgi:hypothetical protein